MSGKRTIEKKYIMLPWSASLESLDEGVEEREEGSREIKKRET